MPKKEDLPLAVLLVRRVRRVVGDHAVDGAVEKALAKGSRVVCGAQGRVHLEVGVVGVGDVVLAQEQVVRGDLAGDGQAVGLGGAHQVKTLAGGDVADVQRALGEADELDVAVDLRAPRPAPASRTYPDAWMRGPR